VGALLVFAEEQYIDCQRNPRRQPKKRVDLSLTGPLRRNRTSLSLSLNENSSYESRFNGLGRSGPRFVDP